MAKVFLTACCLLAWLFALFWGVIGDHQFAPIIWQRVVIMEGAEPSPSYMHSAKNIFPKEVNGADKIQVAADFVLHDVSDIAFLDEKPEDCFGLGADHRSSAKRLEFFQIIFVRRQMIDCAKMLQGWLYRPVEIKGGRLAEVFHCDNYIEGGKAEIGINNFCMGDGKIGAHLRFANFPRNINGVLRSLHRSARGVERSGDIDDAGKGHDKQRAGPERHPPLGLKVLLLAPFIPLGFWISLRGFERKSDILAAAQVGLGGIIASGAITLITI